MAKVTLTTDLAEKFVAALLSVVRTDGQITPEESRAVQAAVAEFVEPVEFDLADAMLVSVTPESLAAAVRKASAAVETPEQRGHVPPVSPANEIGKAFVGAARRVADGDAEMTSHEMAVIRRYADALGADRPE